MSLKPYSPETANREFERARFEAALRHVLARLTRRSDELLSYETVAQQLGLGARSDRGIQTIPVAAIVGSVGRAADFTRSFLPLNAADKQRWARVRNAFLDPNRSGLPAIQVYQVGEAYFVIDGNHRVSVARREGITYIEAEVIEIRTPVPFTPDMTPDDLICKAELAAFLEETGLGDPGFGFDFTASQCGQYPKLRDWIRMHQHVASRAQHRELTYREAAADWLATAYAPLTRALREHDLLKWFPSYTETDLYLWVTEHQQQLREELGWEVRPDAAMTDLAVRSGPRAKSSETAPGRWQRERLADRYLAHLFADILVPLDNSPESWNALEQAIVLAQKEESNIHGLHILQNARAKTTAPVQEMQARFVARCEQANVRGELALETGNVARKICERALLTDLIVLKGHTPGPQSRVRGVLSARGSDWNYIIKNAARPILAASRETSRTERALVIFDGGPKSQEALFIAAYMGENWKTALTVLCVADGAQATNAALDHARLYLDLHELEADYISGEGTGEIVFRIVTEQNPDVLLLGRDDTSAWRATRGGDMLNALLREAGQPVLICS